MIRWLLFALFFYMIYRLITGPRRVAGRRTIWTIRFGDGAESAAGPRTHSGPGRRREPLEKIEDAEFEDITEKEPSEGSGTASSR